MDSKEMLQYLQDAIEQEASIVAQEKTRAEYDQQSLLRKPEQQVEAYPPKPQAKVYEFSGIAAGIFGCIAAAFFLLLISGLAWTDAYEEELREKSGYYQQLLDSGKSYISVPANDIYVGYHKTYYEDQLAEDIADLKGDRSLSYILRFLGFLCIAGAAGLLFHVSRNKTKTEAENNTALNRYQQACRRIEQSNDQHADAYQRDLAAWTASNTEMHAYMAKPLAESRALLDRFYASDVIYPKYRTLPALTSIYEYFMTGRCSELTGPHGAYNLYEDELRKDTVISQLNTVIENLEQIRQNQYMLYQQVKAIQENTAVIASELKQIKGYTVQIAQLTALNAYYAALNERNTRITMYYHL